MHVVSYMTYSKITHLEVSKVSSKIVELSKFNLHFIIIYRKTNAHVNHSTF